MRRGASRARSGFTLFEAAIVVVLMSIALGVAAIVTRSSQDALKTSTLAARMDGEGRRAMQRIKELLRGAGANAITPRVAAPFGTDRVEFRRAVRIEDGAPVWGPLESLSFQYVNGELDDGLDNDGNGLVDEGRVVWVPDVLAAERQEVVLASYVPDLFEGETENVLDDNENGLIDERGLCFDFDGPIVNVRLTLQEVDDRGRFLTRSFRVSIQCRN